MNFESSIYFISIKKSGETSLVILLVSFLLKQFPYGGFFVIFQESVYQAIQENGRNRGSTSVHSHGSDESHSEEEEGESSHGGSTNSQVALDEALARSLQELGDDFEDFHLHEHSDAESGKKDVSLI